MRTWFSTHGQCILKVFYFTIAFIQTILYTLTHILLLSIHTHLYTADYNDISRVQSDDI